MHSDNIKKGKKTLDCDAGKHDFFVAVLNYKFSVIVSYC